MPASRSQVEAERLRADRGLASGAIDVFEVVRSLGCELYFHPFAESPIEGAVKRMRGLSFVLVNGTRPLVRQRFTAAHEIGHLRLDGESDGIVESLAGMNTSSSADERNANSFAAYLLMDAAGVNALVAEVAEPWERIARVAVAYVVSPQAAAIHLGTLGLLAKSVLDDFTRLASDDRDEIKARLKVYGYRQPRQPKFESIDQIDPRHIDDALRELAAGLYTRRALAADLGLDDGAVAELLVARGVSEPEQSETDIWADLDLEGRDGPG